MYLMSKTWRPPIGKHSRLSRERGQKLKSKSNENNKI